MMNQEGHLKEHIESKLKSIHERLLNLEMKRQDTRSPQKSPSQRDSADEDADYVSAGSRDLGVQKTYFNNLMSSEKKGRSNARDTLKDFIHYKLDTQVADPRNQPLTLEKFHSFNDPSVNPIEKGQQVQYSPEIMKGPQAKMYGTQQHGVSPLIINKPLVAIKELVPTKSIQLAVDSKTKSQQNSSRKDKKQLNMFATGRQSSILSLIATKPMSKQLRTSSRPSIPKQHSSVLPIRRQSKNELSVDGLSPCLGTLATKMETKSSRRLSSANIGTKKKASKKKAGAQTKKTFIRKSSIQNSLVSNSFDKPFEKSLEKPLEKPKTLAQKQKQLPKNSAKPKRKLNKSQDFGRSSIPRNSDINELPEQSEEVLSAEYNNIIIDTQLEQGPSNLYYNGAEAFQHTQEGVDFEFDFYNSQGFAEAEAKNHFFSKTAHIDSIAGPGMSRCQQSSIFDIVGEGSSFDSHSSMPQTSKAAAKKQILLPDQNYNNKEMDPKDRDESCSSSQKPRRSRRMRLQGQPSSSTSLEAPREMIQDDPEHEGCGGVVESKETSVAEVNLSALDLNRSDIKIKPQANDGCEEADEGVLVPEQEPIAFQEPSPDYRDSFGVGLHSRERDNLRKTTPFSPDDLTLSGRPLQVDDEMNIFSTSESPFSHVVDESANRQSIEQSAAERVASLRRLDEEPRRPLEMVKQNQTALDSLFFEGEDNHIRSSVSRQIDPKDRYKNPYISDNLRKPSTSKKQVPSGSKSLESQVNSNIKTSLEEKTLKEEEKLEGTPSVESPQAQFAPQAEAPSATNSTPPNPLNGSTQEVKDTHRSKQTEITDPNLVALLQKSHRSLTLNYVQSSDSQPFVSEKRPVEGGEDSLPRQIFARNSMHISDGGSPSRNLVPGHEPQQHFQTVEPELDEPLEEERDEEDDEQTQAVEDTPGVFRQAEASLEHPIENFKIIEYARVESEEIFDPSQMSSRREVAAAEMEPIEEGSVYSKPGSFSHESPEQVEQLKENQEEVEESQHKEEPTQQELGDERKHSASHDSPQQQVAPAEPEEELPTSSQPSLEQEEDGVLNVECNNFSPADQESVHSQSSPASAEQHQMSDDDDSKTPLPVLNQIQIVAPVQIGEEEYDEEAHQMLLQSIKNNILQQNMAAACLINQNLAVLEEQGIQIGANEFQEFHSQTNPPFLSMFDQLTENDPDLDLSESTATNMGMKKHMKFSKFKKFGSQMNKFHPYGQYIGHMFSKANFGLGEDDLDMYPGEDFGEDGDPQSNPFSIKKKLKNLHKYRERIQVLNEDLNVLIFDGEEDIEMKVEEQLKQDLHSHVSKNIEKQQVQEQEEANSAVADNDDSENNYDIENIMQEHDFLGRRQVDEDSSGTPPNNHQQNSDIHEYRVVTSQYDYLYDNKGFKDSTPSEEEVIEEDPQDDGRELNEQRDDGAINLGTPEEAPQTAPDEDDEEGEGMNNIEVEFSDDSQEKAPINSQDLFEELEASAMPMNIQTEKEEKDEESKLQYKMEKMLDSKTPCIQEEKSEESDSVRSESPEQLLHLSPGELAEVSKEWSAERLRQELLRLHSMALGHSPARHSSSNYQEEEET